MATMDELTVTIPLSRYEELVDIETRCDMLLAKLNLDEDVSTTDMYLLLGESEKAYGLKAKEEQELREWNEKHNFITVTKDEGN